MSSAYLAQSDWSVEYTDCFNAEGEDPPPTSVLDMTLNNDAGALGNVEYPFIASVSMSTMAQNGSI